HPTETRLPDHGPDSVPRAGPTAPFPSTCTSTLPRVACEYGQISSCASLASAASSACGKVESSTRSFTASPKPPPSRGPIDTSAVTLALLASFSCCLPTKSSAPPKQAADPAAKRCSGVVVPGLPGPPMAFGTERSALTKPSLAWVWPFRPPVAVAAAVESGFMVCMTGLHRREFSPAREAERAQC